MQFKQCEESESPFLWARECQKLTSEVSLCNFGVQDLGSDCSDWPIRAPTQVQYWTSWLRLVPENGDPDCKNFTDWLPHCSNCSEPKNRIIATLQCLDGFGKSISGFWAIWAVSSFFAGFSCAHYPVQICAQKWGQQTDVQIDSDCSDCKVELGLLFLYSRAYLNRIRGWQESKELLGRIARIAIFDFRTQNLQWLTWGSQFWGLEQLFAVPISVCVTFFSKTLECKKIGVQEIWEFQLWKIKQHYPGSWRSTVGASVIF